MTTNETYNQEEVGVIIPPLEPLLPVGLTVVGGALRAALLEMNVRAEFFLTDDYHESEGIVKAIICGEGVSDALDNFTLMKT